MNFSTPDMNMQVEASRADRFIQVQIGITVTPELASQVLMAVRGARDNLPGLEDPKRSAFIDEIVRKVSEIASEIQDRDA